MIDSNVYIDLLRTKKDPVTVLWAWSRQTGTQLVICGMVRVEVLRGVTSSKTYRGLADYMDAMVNVPTTNRLWDDTVALAWKLDRKGLVIPGADAVIAASAMKLDAAVMTSDAHFSNIEGLRVIAPPEEWLA